MENEKSKEAKSKDNIYMMNWIRYLLKLNPAPKILQINFVRIRTFWMNLKGFLKSQSIWLLESKQRSFPYFVWNCQNLFESPARISGRVRDKNRVRTGPGPQAKNKVQSVRVRKSAIKCKVVFKKIQIALKFSTFL